jgi:cysteine desulfurase/selenocysteine lyase
MSTPSVLSDMRSRFPTTKQWTYFDVAARGILSIGTRDAIDGYLDHRMAEGGDKPWMFEQVEKAREGFAALIGAHPDEVALTKNVSEGINSFATALAWREGDNVVLCESVEHPANVFPWYNLAKLRGVTLKLVEPVNGHIPLEKMLAAIDGKTRVVAISSVSFSPGFRFPLATLTEHCRKRGVLVLVDAAQSVGVLHTDVKTLGIDALATSTQKGLLALYGTGFLYVRREIASTMNPVYLSRSGVSIDARHEAAVGDLTRYELAAGARRFDVGNYNYIGAIAVEHSIRELAAVGTQAIERHVCRLAAKLAEGLVEAGVPVFGGAELADRAHIVAVGTQLDDQHDATSNERISALHRHFNEARIRHTIRRGVMRLSLHCYNNEEDVAHVVATARHWMASGRQGSTVTAGKSKSISHSKESAR